jgi:NADH dehydrogenase [ubiquinone] 1 alpha subcomplex assembly factor 1
MKLFALCFILACSFSQSPKHIAFGKQAGRTATWVILSDNVMGGISTAQLNYTDSAVVLRGYVSLKNRGGFVSLKSRFSEYDLSKYKTIRIKFKATGQQYAFTLENSIRWYEPAYKHVFTATAADTWQQVTLPLNQFQEERIGQPTGNMITETILKQVLRLGIMTIEKKEGSFEITIESIIFE